MVIDHHKAMLLQSMQIWKIYIHHFTITVEAQDRTRQRALDSSIGNTHGASDGNLFVLLHAHVWQSYKVKEMDDRNVQARHSDNIVICLLWTDAPKFRARIVATTCDYLRT